MQLQLSYDDNCQIWMQVNGFNGCFYTIDNLPDDVSVTLCLDGWESGPLFTKGWDVLPPSLIKSRS